MNKVNFLKEKLFSGKPVIGTWSVIPSAITADIIASSGIDFIIIDAEHGPINFETAQEMIIACESRKVSPIMRIASINEQDILKALDIGIHGIQIPNIANKKDVEQIINFSKYPPLGNRGFSPFTRSAGFFSKELKNLTSESNKNTLIGINIEDINSINNIDDILSIKSLDIIFIGLYDLSKSMGIPGEVDHPKITEILKNLTKKILNAGKYPGTIATNELKMEEFVNMGMKYILFSVDCAVIKSRYLSITNKFKSLL